MASDKPEAATAAPSSSTWQDELLPHIIDRIAAETPERIYGLWPVAPFSYDAGFRTITFGQLANAVNRLAWWIDEHLGKGKDCEVLTYVGPNDVRYAALLLAAIKTGYIIFLTSPRNSPAAHKALFEALHCNTLLTTNPTPPPAAAVIEAVQPRSLAIPNLDQLLGSEPAPAYAFDQTFDRARNDPVLAIHTSGSTGLPKPLIWTHETVARHQRLSSLAAAAAPNGVPSVEELIRGKRVLVTLPPFHRANQGAGVTQYLFHTSALDIIAVAPAARGIVTAQGLVEALKQTPAEIALLVPSVVAELSQDPELLDYCAKNLELILYIGGDLPKAVGDAVAAKVPLRCQWGASETGIPQQLVPPEFDPATDWRHVQFHPSLGAEFDEVADGLYELVIPRREDLKSTQALFTIKGQDKLEKEYRTRDYFAKHPTVPNAWSWCARADDIIVFLNGEKTNPISMEQQIVARSPEINGAVVIGAQRFQAALLIQPADAEAYKTTAEQAALVERVWPSVAEANRQAPAHARVEKPLILVASADRPMIRSGKGTVQRAATLDLYSADIDRLYKEAESADADAVGEPSYPRDIIAIQGIVRDAVLSVTEWHTLDDSENFFDRGLDSLQALRITRALRRALGHPTLALSTVYKDATIKDLAATILEIHSETTTSDQMAGLLSTYTKLLKQIPAPTVVTREGPVDVVLTGSTGHLGTYMLNSLLNRPGIGHIFCLNRGSDGGHQAQIQRLRGARLPTNVIDKRVTFLSSDLAHPKLGLDDETYETLTSRAGLIIHNAWPVNFILDLQNFRPQLAGIVNLSALSSAAAGAQILFISTIGAAGSTREPAPEDILESLDTPHPNGYSQSKFLSELILDEAAKGQGIPVAVARVGQVAGPINHGGLWNPKEWLPSLIGSSMYLGCLPDNLGQQFTEIDWIPSDVLAEVVVDISTSLKRSPGGAQVFNLRNPMTTSWTELIPAVQAAAKIFLGKPLAIVKPSVWVDKMQESIAAIPSSSDMSAMTAAVAKNPGIRLYEFYRDNLWSEAASSPPMAVARAAEASKSLRDLPAVNQGWMGKWLKGWAAVLGG